MPGTICSPGPSPSSVSLIAFGCPGGLRIEALPRILRPAAKSGCRDELEADLPHLLAESSISLSATARVASGVTSRCGPVPPVVARMAALLSPALRRHSITGRSSNQALYRLPRRRGNVFEPLLERGIPSSLYTLQCGPLWNEADQQFFWSILEVA
jgi:hypothetical protein